MGPGYAARTDARWVLYPLLLLVGLAMSPMLTAACAARSFIYHPTQVPPHRLETVASLSGMELVSLETETGITLRGSLRPPTDPQQPWVLLFGGNAMSLADAHWVFDQIGDGGFGRAAFAYRGYDGSTGDPTEEGLFHDAQAIARYLSQTHQAEPGQLVLMGQSLGSGPATHLAAELNLAGEPPRGLVLLSPFTSMPRVFDAHVPLIPIGWVVPDRFDNLSRASDLAGPITIVHGTRDQVVPVAHGEALAQALGERGHLELLEGRGHNDLWQDPATIRAVRDLLEP